VGYYGLLSLVVILAGLLILLANLRVPGDLSIGCFSSLTLLSYGGFLSIFTLRLYQLDDGARLVVLGLFYLLLFYLLSFVFDSSRDLDSRCYCPFLHLYFTVPQANSNRISE